MLGLHGSDYKEHSWKHNIFCQTTVKQCCFLKQYRALNVCQLSHCKISHTHHPLFPYLSLVFILIIMFIPAPSHCSAALAYQEPLYWEVLKWVLCQFCPILFHFPYFIYLEDGLPLLRRKVKCAYFKTNKTIVTAAFRHVCKVIKTAY